jgi:chromosome segregation ATPase
MRLFSLLSLLLLASLTSCSFLKEAMLGPEREPDVDPRTTHLAMSSGGQDQSDLGPDAHSLLESFTRLKGEYFELKSKMEKVEAQNKQLRSALENSEKNMSVETAKRAVAEAETERLRKEIRTRDTELLSISIRKAKRDHEYYALKVAMLKDQLRSLGTPLDHQPPEPAYEPTSPPSGRER